MLLNPITQSGSGTSFPRGTCLSRQMAQCERDVMVAYQPNSEVVHFSEKTHLTLSGACSIECILACFKVCPNFAVVQVFGVLY